MERTNEQTGFMYIEVLISLVLLSFVLLSLAPLFIIAGQENASARDQTLATTLASDQAERMKRIAFDQVVDGADRIQIRSMWYRRAWTVVDDSPHPGFKTVTVTVVPGRRGGLGGTRTATLSFYRVAL